MGRKILTNSIVDPNIQQPFVGPSLEFLQQWNTDQNFAILRALIGDINYGIGPFAIYGMRNTGSGANFIIGAGFLVFDGELYACAGITVTTTGSDVIVGTVTSGFDTGIDPIEFTDLVPRSVHQIKTIVLSAGATGSADFDYSAMTFIQDKPEDMFVFSTASGETATSALSVLKFATDIFDAQGWHNTSTGKIQPTRSGKFKVSIKSIFTIAASLGGSFVLELQFFKNGSLIDNIDIIAYAGGSVPGSMDGFFYSSANGSTDYFEIKVALTSSQTWSMSGHLEVEYKAP